METINLENDTYEVIKNVKEGIDKEEIEKKYTDYFKDFDYIVGDWAYGKLRLKGFNDKTNKNFKPINDISKVDDYIQNQCAYECRYFILKKQK